MKTYQPTQKDIKREWHLIDARGKVLGRMASQAAQLLMGKGKSAFSKHMDMGDYVVVINAREIMLTGKKRTQKTYFRHSGYPGGLKEIKFSKLISEQAGKVIEHAVAGMLPDNRLKSARLRRLKVFADDNYPYKDKFKGS